MREEGLTPRQVIRAAKTAGFHVSDDQLHRWRAKDLIPRPKRQGLGRPKGMASHYPPGADKQAIALCEALSEDRRLDLAAIALYFQGYPISGDRILSILEGTLHRRKKELNGLLDDDGLTKHGWETLKKLRRGRLRHPGLSRARQRLRLVFFETFARMLLFVTSGRTPDILWNSTEPGTDMQILKKGFGVDKAQEFWLDMDDDELRSAISSIATPFTPRALRETLASTSDTDLLASRREFLAILGVLQDVKFVFSFVAGKDAFGLSGVPEIDLRNPDPLSPMLLLGWLQLRKLPEVASNIPVIIKLSPIVSSLRRGIEENRRFRPSLRKMLISSVRS